MLNIRRKGFRLKLDVQGQRDAKSMDVDGKGGVGPKNQTIFMNVIRISFLIQIYQGVRMEIQYMQFVAPFSINLHFTKFY